MHKFRVGSPKVHNLKFILEIERSGDHENNDKFNEKNTIC